ncbi:MAG TPA: matrixin family metalloprotease [Clostridia bacterium]|nr:matrixin family metalloprotease [Clostridia bacterium]
MKKKFWVVIGLIVLTFFLKQSVFAKNEERPKGLDERGPLTKITFIHYKKAQAKPPRPGKPAKESSCYQFLAKGAKWKEIEPYWINPSNSGLPGSFANQAIDAGVTEWEKYAQTEIFGQGSLTNSASYNETLDNLNVASFGQYPNPNVIAITSIWGYFSGPPQWRELVEWDILFNTNFQWGDAKTNSSLMDLQNIATHELGHSAGMGDLYETVCSAETMYGYSGYGETDKRDLNAGDIKGIQELY